MSAVVETDQGPLELHNAHIPDGSSNELGKVQAFVDLYASLAVRSKLPRILCGDFNSPAQERADGSVTFFGDGRHRDLWMAAERSVLLGLESSGLTDVYRHLHGYERQAASWISKGTGKERRFDHFIASRRSLHPRTCEYHHAWLEDGLSDHASVEATFEWPEANDPPSDPLEIRAGLKHQQGRVLLSRNGREHRILALTPDQVLVATADNPEGVAVRTAWIEAAARRLQVDGKLEVTPSTLGTMSASIGAILTSLPGVGWREKLPASLSIEAAA